MKVVSIVVNNPKFIELQYQSIKRYLGDFELIIFNDGKSWPDESNFFNPHLKEEIVETCSRLNLRHFEILNEHGKGRPPSERHALAMNFVTQWLFDNPDRYLILDSDMFFIDTFSLDQLNDCYLYCCLQRRVVNGQTLIYPWPNLLFLDTTSVPHRELINWDVRPGLDAGGSNVEWLKTLDPEKIREFSWLSSCNWSRREIPFNLYNHKIVHFLERDFRNLNGRYFAEIYNHNIFHYRAGTNWEGRPKEHHQRLFNLLFSVLE